MELAARVQILDEAISVYVIEKGIKPSRLHPSYWWIVRQTGFIHIGRESREQRKFWIQTNYTPLKTDLVSHPAHSSGVWVNTYLPPVTSSCAAEILNKDIDLNPITF